MFISNWWWVVGGGPYDYCVSPIPKNCVFGFQNLGPVWTRDLDLGLRLIEISGGNVEALILK